jgi:hypothetical protein
MFLTLRDATEHDMKGAHPRKRVPVHPEELADRGRPVVGLRSFKVIENFE